MAGLGPLAPLVGAAAMIGLALATLVGRNRVPPDTEPPPETPAEAMRKALARFAHWLPQQPVAVRHATAGPSTSLLSDGASLVEALAISSDPDRLMGVPAIMAAHAAITRDLPETMAILDALPVSARVAVPALTPFTGALATIAAATSTAWAAIQADAATALEVQHGYLGSKYRGEA